MRRVRSRPRILWTVAVVPVLATFVAVAVAVAAPGEPVWSLPATRLATGGEVEWVAEHFGAFEDAVVVGDHLYAAIGSRLVVFDADLAATAAPVASLPFADAWPLALAATEDQRLVVLCRALGSGLEIRVLDLSQPTSPRPLARRPVDQLRYWGSPEFVLAGEGRAWIGAGETVVAFNLDGPEGVYETGRWKAPSGFSSEIQAMNRIDGFLVVAVYPHPQHVWVLDTRPERPMEPVGTPIPLEASDMQVAIGDRWMASSSPSSGEVALWRMSEPGRLARAGALSSGWLDEAGIQDVHEHHLASNGDMLWLAGGETVHLIDLARRTPVVVDRATAPSLRPVGPMVHFEPLLRPAAERGLILRRRGLHRLTFAAAGTLGPLRTAELVTGEVTHVFADPRGAWARVDEERTVALWRVRGEGAPVQVEDYVSAGLDSDGERLFIADGQDLRVLREEDDGSLARSTVDSSAIGGFETQTGIVAGAPSDGLLVRQGVEWQHVGLEGDRVVSRTRLLGIDGYPVLAGGVPWVHRSDGMGAVLIAAMDLQGVPGQRWPGLSSAVPFDAVAGRGRTLAVAHRGPIDARISILGWDDDLQPRILGSLDTGAAYSASDNTFGASIALSDGVAWLVTGSGILGDGLLVMAVDISVPSAPDEIGRTRIPGANLLSASPVVAASGDHAWIVDGATGALHELRLRRAATSVGPTRPAPTARPATATPTAMPTATAGPAGENRGTLHLPWMSRP